MFSDYLSLTGFLLVAVVVLGVARAAIKQGKVGPQYGLSLKPIYPDFSLRGFFMKIKTNFCLHLACAIVSVSSLSLALFRGIGRYLSIFLPYLVKGLIGAAYLVAYGFGMVMLIPLLYDGILINLFALSEDLGAVTTFTVIAVVGGVILAAVLGYFYRQSPALCLERTGVFMRAIFYYGLLTLLVTFLYLQVCPDYVTSELVRFVAWFIYGGAFLLPLVIWGAVSLVRWAYRVAPECAERAGLH